MDLLAIDVGPRAEWVRALLGSARQNPPSCYGSSFSRGVALGAGPRTILVSGTSSIGLDGRTRHARDPEGQVL